MDITSKSGKEKYPLNDLLALWGVRLGMVGLLGFIVVPLASIFGWLEMPITQYAAMVVLIFAIGGFGLMFACFTKRFGIYLFLLLSFIGVCVFSILEVPVLTPVARLLLCFLFRKSAMD